jgi:hypothetical protein
MKNFELKKVCDLTQAELFAGRPRFALFAMALQLRIERFQSALNDYIEYQQLPTACVSVDELDKLLSDELNKMKIIVKMFSGYEKEKMLEIVERYAKTMLNDKLNNHE